MAKTNEEKFAARRAAYVDEPDIEEIVWTNGGPPPTEAKAMARLLEHLLDPEDLLQDETGDWLARLGLKTLDMAKVREALSSKFGPAVKRTLARARKVYAREAEEVQELAEVGWVRGREAPRALADETAVISALRRLEADKPGGLHSIGRELRPLCALSHDAFDRALLSLARRHEVVLHHTDLPSSLTAPERAEALEAEGHTFIGAALAG